MLKQVIETLISGSQEIGDEVVKPCKHTASRSGLAVLFGGFRWLKL
jgi:hypothetical protein